MAESSCVSLITGAASGLGWELTQRYARLGHRLLLVDRDAVALRQKQQQLQHDFPPVQVDIRIQDLADAHAAQAVADWVASQTVQLNLLINNAGITHRSLAETTNPAVFRRVMAVDYFAPLELTLALAPMLRAAPAHPDNGVIVIGSMAGWMPVLGRAGYCAAKAALHQFFETARAEGLVAAKQLTLVYPSFLATPIEQNALDHNGNNAQHRRTTTGKIRSAQWMAERIVKAHRQGQQRCFPDRFASAAALLYRLWPRLFLRLMRQRFSAELNTATMTSASESPGR